MLGSFFRFDLTPQDLVNELDSVSHYDLDACATPANAKCKRHFTKEDDELRQTWTGTVSMNPPYGRQIEAFMKKACESYRDSATVLLAACPDRHVVVASIRKQGTGSVSAV